MHYAWNGNKGMYVGRHLYQEISYKLNKELD